MAAGMRMAGTKGMVQIGVFNEYLIRFSQGRIRFEARISKHGSGWHRQGSSR